MWSSPSRSMQEKKRREEENTLQFIFEKIDTDRSGTIDRAELRELFQTSLADKGISDEDLEIIINRIDVDHDGAIDYNEFRRAFEGSKSLDDLIDTSYLHLLFSKIDKDNSDAIDVNEIMELFDEEEAMTKSDKEKLLQIIDSDHSGSIEFSEFKRAFRSLGCKSTNDLIEKSYLHIVFQQIDQNKNTVLDISEWKNLFEQQAISLNDEEVYRLVESIDADKDGQIDFYEFEQAFKKIKSIPDLIKKSRLHVIFNSIDTDHSNSLEFDEIRTLFKQENMNVSDDNLHHLIRLIDKNNDGIIDFEEFEDAFDEIESIDELLNKWSNMVSIDVGTDLSVSSGLHSSELSLAALFPIVAGGTGGICSRTCTAPLERVKILAQCGTSRQSILGTWGEVIAAQGFFRGLWRGNLYNCLRVFPFGGLVTFTYGNVTKYLHLSDTDKYSYLWRFGAGLAAGGLATTLTYPLDLIRTQITNSMSGEKQKMREMLGMNGFRGMFKGLWPTLFAMSLFVGVQNSSYDFCRLYITSPRYLNVQPSVELFIGCGMAAGVFAQTVVYPLDVIRRRIQVSATEPNSPNLKENILKTTTQRNMLSSRTWMALTNVVKQEGARSLFAGLVPTYMKVVPSVAISVTIRDILLGRLNPDE